MTWGKGEGSSFDRENINQSAADKMKLSLKGNGPHPPPPLFIACEISRINGWGGGNGYLENFMTRY